MTAGDRGAQKTPLTPGRFVRTLVVVIVGVPMLTAANFTIASALVSAGMYAVQRIQGTVVTGTLTDAEFRVVTGNRQRDPYRCHGSFTSDDGTVTRQRIRVWITDADCLDAKGSRARLLPAAGTPVSALIERIAWAPDRPVSGPIAFSGLYGTTEGALVGDDKAFVAGLWPYAFIVPFAVFFDWALISTLLARVRSRRRRR